MSAILKILYFTRRFWQWYLFMGLFTIAVSLLALATPILSKNIVDIIVGEFSHHQANLQLLIILLASILAVDILTTILTAVGQWIGDLLTVKMQTYLSEVFYKHILSLHIGYFDNQVTGTIVNKMYRGISSITEFIQNMMNNFLPFFLTAIATVILLAHYSLFIGLLLAILFPVYIFISHSSTVAWEKFETKKNELNDISQGRVFESISGIRIVKSFASEIVELTTFGKYRKDIERFAARQTKQWHTYDFLRRIILNVILFSIFAYIVYWTFYGRFTIGEMTLLLQLVNQARFPLFAMSFILGQIQQANAGSADFFQLLEVKNEITDSPHAKDLLLPSEKKETKVPLISFHNVSFAYNHDQPILSNISFNIYKNERLALVGASGEGKSTLVNLLLRYYQPEKGTISVYNQNIATITQSSLRKTIAVVFQDSLLFSGSIAENIRYGTSGAKREDIIHAARAANAEEFIEKLSDKYNSLIGERGVKLSGGQKQRIAIARAILKNAPCIILDEATSSLDSKAELLVQKGLNELLKNRTSIIIAHRLSTISNADHILVLDKGKIAQYGTPKDLLKDQNGIYSQLIHLQRQLLETPSEEKSEKLKQFGLVG